MKRNYFYTVMALLSLLVVGIEPALAQDDPAPEEPPLDEPQMLPEEPHMPGTVEGTGTYFEVTDSDYLNITLTSSEPVNLMLESIPQTVVMDVEAAEGATSTQITLHGFAPLTTYWKYEDGYDDGVTFTADSEGSYTYTQGVSEPHTIFIQPGPGTLSVPGDTHINGIEVATYDGNTYKLVADINVGLYITDFLRGTLDGNGHTVTGDGSGSGVSFDPRGCPDRLVTIKNLKITGFGWGIYLPKYFDRKTLSDNTIWDCAHGIDLDLRNDYNTLTGNVISDCWYNGIFVSRGRYNTLTGNIVSYNSYHGIALSSSQYTTLTGNEASNNSQDGIWLRLSGGTTLTGNVANSNGRYGICLSASAGCTMTGNAMSGNLYNFGILGDFHHNMDMTNTLDGKRLYYLRGVADQVHDSTTASDAGAFYAVYCDNITIRDLTFTNNGQGVCLLGTQNSTVENVTASNNVCGIYVQGGSGNTLIGNTATNNAEHGIRLFVSEGNTVEGNIASNNYDGIALSVPRYPPGPGLPSTVTGNTASFNERYGISVQASFGDMVTRNTASDNGEAGILLGNSRNATLAQNTVSSNMQYGIYVYSSSNNQIYNNNFINNVTHAYVGAYSTGNVFNLDKPVGGNYWSDWTAPDEDGDGFVDSPYMFYGGHDDLPLVDTVTDLDSDGVFAHVEDAGPNGGDGNKDGILDSKQENVASLPNAQDGRYVTLASPDGTQLVNVIAVGNPSPDDAPSGVAFPLGFFEFTVQGVTPGGSTTVTLHLPQKIDTYYKYGPNWYEFLFDGTTGAEIFGKRVVLHFVDGARGDDDLTANGEIVEPGAAGIAPRTWLGFLPPLPSDKKRLFKRGSTIPVKFRISDPEGMPVSEAFARLAVYYEDEGAADGAPEVVSTAAGDWGDQFRYDPKDDLYIFNLSTKDASYEEYWTYRIIVTLDDGQKREVGFSLK